ncbi:MAG: hypothetical protein WBZ36_28625 [Candidatus Nitrosopolaris sp.]
MRSDDNINPTYLNAVDKFTKEEIENANKAADHWYYKIGANVIPADTKIKKAWILNSWDQYQSNQVLLEVFEKWKQLGLFAYGIAVVLGPLWRGKNAGKYLNLIDADNRLALQEICTRNGKIISLEQLAKWTLVEQHKDDIDRGHIYILSTKPFPIKASDKGKPDTANKIANNEIPGIEVKNVGSLSFCWNSIHEGGCRYELVVETDPVLCHEFPEHINSICKKYGLDYLDEHGRGKGDISIPELFKEDTVIYEGSNRHKAQLRVNDSLVTRLKNILSLDEIRQIAMKWNQDHCRSPLDDGEFNKLFNQSASFILKNNVDEKGNNNAGINEYETTGIDETSSSELDQQEMQLVKEKLTGEQIAFVMETLTKKAPYDIIPIKQLFYGMSSAFTKSPIPHNVNSKDAGAGKSYLLSLVAGHFPNRYVLPLTGMSDKAIFHRPGIMVIEKHDDESGEVEVIPIAPIVRKLELEKAEIEAQKQMGCKLRIKEIEADIKDIYEKAEKLIDLNNQIILGLDTPQDSLFDAIMALMSQDFPGDQKYEYAEKSSSNKMGRRVNRLRGMPVLFTSRVIDDTRGLRFLEKNRRFINVNPATSSNKIHAANDLIALTYGSLPEEYDNLVVSRQDTKRCKKIIEIIVAKLKQHSAYLKPKESGIVIPFHNAISKSIPVSENQPWSMTVTDRTFKYLSIVTKINMDNRPRVVNTETGQFWPITTFEDLKETLFLMERAASGVRPYLVNWFNDVFIPAFKDLDGHPNEMRTDNSPLLMKERYVGVTTEQLAEKTKKVYGGLKPSSGDLLNKYLYPLINQGIVDKVPSEIDKRFNIFFPVEATTGGSNIFALFQDPDDIRLKAPIPNAYPTKNLIEDSIRISLEYYYKEGVGNERKYRLIDVDGKEITPGE